MKHNYLVIEGNIGSGKTSLATMLSKKHDARLILEKFSDNPFLPKFYDEPRQFAFPLELSFLAERYHQMKNELTNLDLFSTMAIADFYFSKCLIFANINLQEDEYSLYQKLFNIIFQMLPKPDLVVYLNQPSDQLIKNIRKRGRAYEQAIDEQYLDKVNKGYLSFFRQHQKQFKTLIINLLDYDFVNNETHFKAIENLIGREYPEGISIVELSSDQAFQEN